MLSIIWLKFSKWILLAFGLLVTIGSIFYAGRKSGATKAEANAANMRAADREAIAVRHVNEEREASNKSIEVVQNAKEIVTENASVADADVNKRLRDQWSRD